MRVGPLKVKAQLFCGDEAAMGPGKADLLEAIGREGSSNFEQHNKAKRGLIVMTAGFSALTFT